MLFCWLSMARRKDLRMSAAPVPNERHLLVVAHTGREDSLQAGVQVCRQLIAAGLVPVVSDDERAGLPAAPPCPPPPPPSSRFTFWVWMSRPPSSNWSSCWVVTAPSCGLRSWPAHP